VTLYARHEEAVLRFFMERVRSPELACDLLAETFAVALAGGFDETRETEAAWILQLAETQLRRAYRVGTVDASARAALRLAPVALDDRTLDRVWRLRGEARNEAPKPAPSGWIVAGPHASVDVLAHSSRNSTLARSGAAHGDDASGPGAARGGEANGPGAARGRGDASGRGEARDGGGGRGAARGSGGAGDDGATRGGDASERGAARGGDAPTVGVVVVPGVADALGRAARRRDGGRRRQRRVGIAVRVGLALVTAAWVVGEAVVPDRPAAAPASGWLLYETDDVGGTFPRTWWRAMSPQAPRVGVELVTFTTFETGQHRDPECGALAVMGAGDAIVSILKGRPRAPAPHCVGDAHVRRERIEDGLWALVVLGPESSGAVRDEAEHIVARVRRPA
jgi:hypothetical protein